MSNMPLVSIVSVFYNRASVVSESVKSLVEQSYKNLEIILVDDGSTDNTLIELKKFSSIKNVNVISLKNDGFVNAINHAISISNGKYVAVHGSGDLSHKKRISLQVDALNNHKELGLVACKSMFVNISNSRTYIKGIPRHTNYRYLLLKSNYFHHGEVMFRRSLFETVGGYRPFFKYSQDYDLWCRMSEHSDFALLDEVLYSRYVNQINSVSGDPHKTKLQIKLAQLAVYCHSCRLKENYDPLDRYGEYCAFDMPQKNLSFLYIKQSIRYLISDDINSALIFLQWARKNSFFAPKILQLFLIFIPNISVKLLKMVLKK